MQNLEFTRLFEIMPFQAKDCPQESAFAHKVDGVWKRYSTAEMISWAEKVSYACINYGLQKDDKIAILSPNRPEWNIVDLGTLGCGVVDVPVYPTSSESDYRFIFEHAEVKICFASGEELYNKINSIKDELPLLQEIYTFDHVVGAKHWSEFYKLGEQKNPEELKARQDAIDIHDVATIIYTSGTTGTPKGVMLTHNNYVSNVKAVGTSLSFDPGKRTLSFLPLCHSFERMVVYVYMALGLSVHYAESLETIPENLQEVKPHFFTTVPRLLEKVYEKIMAKGNELTGIKKRLFFWAVELGLKFELNKDLGALYNMELAIARKLIFSKWLEALGGEVEGIVTGAAALNPKLGTLFTAAGIAIVEGYGLTESSPVITSNRLEEEDRKLGTIGIPIPGVEVKIAEDGEILARGPNIMKGYYKRPDLTAETVDEDGWLHTGDVGEFVGKFLKITDRKKELFKTSGGKYIAPQALETKMKESPLIEQIMVVGNEKKFVSALIVPSFVNLRAWAEERGIDNTENEVLIHHPQVITAFLDDIENLNTNFGKWETIKKFTLLANEWGAESGELTPTMKLKRKVILEKYNSHVEHMYEES